MSDEGNWMLNMKPEEVFYNKVKNAYCRARGKALLNSIKKAIEEHEQLVPMVAQARNNRFKANGIKR